jgi:hypothetical protein
LADANNGRLNRGRRSSLFLATLGALGFFALVVAWIAIFGSAKDGKPLVTLPLQQVSRAPSDGGQVATPKGPPRFVNGNLVADPALMEDTAIGPLPRVGTGGRRPMDAYARAFTDVSKRPRIAIVLTGLGISQKETALALAKLPPVVTFAFSPYAAAPQTLVDAARGKGHEVLVEVPMEPFDFPDSDPGPRTLLASAPRAENEQRLAWTLTRFTGYAGAVNSQGGRFLSEAGALAPVIEVLSKRGILWVDVSSAETSATAGVIARVKAPGVTGAMRIDAIQTPEAIDEKLLDLEALSKQSGTAVGVASAYPVSIERIAAWAAKAEKRGFALAPVTAAALQPSGASGGP